MKLYFSGNSGSLAREKRIWEHVKFPHRCLSYAYLGARRNDQLTAFDWYETLPGAPRIFMDSGAFTLQSDVSVTLATAKKFAQGYHAFLNSRPKLIEHYVSVDWRRDGAISADMQRRMEDWGMKPLPVFHAETEFRWLEAICKKGYKVVCVSKPDRSSPRELNRMYNRIFHLATAAGVQIHGLSETGQNVLRYPFYSADSTSWLQDAGRNCIMFIDGDRGKLRRLTFGKAASPYRWEKLTKAQQETIIAKMVSWGFMPTTLESEYTEKAAWNAMTFLKALKDNTLDKDQSRWTPIV